MGKPEEKKRIFIGSSGAKIALAKELSKKLKSESVEVKLWSDQFPPSGTTFQDLIAQCKGCDFAAFLLTEDDLCNKKNKGEVLVPRDNVVFELGLFIGALRYERERWFMVCDENVKKDQDRRLPSDLKSVTTLSLKDAAETIKEVMAETPRFAHTVLMVMSSEDLARRELPEPSGNLKIKQGCAAVLVNSDEPVEQKSVRLAEMVLRNIKADARYEYFYGGLGTSSTASSRLEPGCVEGTANLIQAIAWPDAAKETLAPEQRIRLILQNKKEVKTHLEQMRGPLSIHFRRRPPLRFCVHNPDSQDYAVCYLRYKAGFVQWTEQGDAVLFAKELAGSCDTKTPDACIFHPTPDLDFGRAVCARNQLQIAIEKRFPKDLHKDLENVCFGM